MIELRGVTKTFGAEAGRRPPRPDGPRRRAVRLPRPQRRGQDDDDQDGLRPARPDLGRRSGSAAIPRASQEARQLLAYVPDQPYLYEKLTGREFLRFVVEMYGLDRRRRRRRIDELIETFEMGDFVDELCENYSQGMKQRVVFASALVHDPKVLIVDEPLVGLDPRSARIVKDLFVVAGAVGRGRADVDPPAVDRRGAGRHDRDRRPRPDAGRRARWPSSASRLQHARAARGPVPEADRRTSGRRPTAGPAAESRPGPDAMSLAIPGPVRADPDRRPPIAGRPRRFRWLRWRLLQQHDPHAAVAARGCGCR